MLPKGCWTVYLGRFCFRFWSTKASIVQQMNAMSLRVQSTLPSLWLELQTCPLSIETSKGTSPWFIIFSFFNRCCRRHLLKRGGVWVLLCSKPETCVVILMSSSDQNTSRIPRDSASCRLVVVSSRETCFGCLVEKISLWCVNVHAKQYRDFSTLLQCHARLRK